ncbi:MAG: hypothetical protein U0X58_00790 [Flavobacteriaceae bacterium]
MTEISVWSIIRGISVGAVGDLNGDGFLDVLNNNVVRYANQIRITGLV